MAASQTLPTPGPDDPDERPTAEVLRSLVANGQELAKKELELAKLELKEIVTARLIALALVVAAAMVAPFILAFAGVTGAKALEAVLAPWLAWLIVTAAYALVALLLVAIAYGLTKRPPNKLVRARASVDDTVGWAKQRLSNLGDGEGRS